MTLDAYAWHIAEREERSEWEAAYIHGVLEWVRTKTGDSYRKILDVPCGNARLHPYLQKFGYDVYGFDISKELIEEAKGRNPNVWIGDMRDPKAYHGKYDVVLNWFTSFGYFSDEENERVLENFREALRDGGILIIDLPNPALEGPFSMFKRWDRKYVEILEDRQIDEKRREIWLRLFEDSENILKLVKEIKVPLRMYTRKEMVELLHKHGFKVLFTLKDYSFKPADEKARRILYVAVRR